MTVAKTYQVTGECAYFTQDTAYGPTKMLLQRNAIVGPGATAAEIEHNLSVNLITEVDGVDAPSVPDEGAGPVVELTGEVVDPDVEAKRAAARAKLPADGSAPDGRASDEVWREYAVAQGMGRAEVEKASKADLVGALKK